MDSTQRFSNRVENYIRYRPKYPKEVLSFLRQELSLSSDHVIADVGCGTGILSELFLKNGNTVFGVEPNKEMREAGEKLLSKYPKFIVMDATAEATTLEEGSIDFIVAGQAFHWFDRGVAKKEFQRILRPSGWVILLWNERRVDTAFLSLFEDLLKKFGTDYQAVDHRNVDEEILAEFFLPKGFEARIFENQQVFDFEGLKGRLLSSSYVPAEGQPDYDPMIASLAELFQRFAVNHTVTINYDTKLYYGQLA